MYIRSVFCLQEDAKALTVYKQELKNKTPLNLRRSSKYNLLAVLGALQCVDKKQIQAGYSGIYIATDYACSKDVAGLLEKTDKASGLPIMPFDFLNVNSNNVSFYVAKALSAVGKNMVVSSSESVSFETALQVASFDFETDHLDSVLLGAVDASTKELRADIALYNGGLSDQDVSCWIYMDRQSRGSFGKVSSIEEFICLDALKTYLQDQGYTRMRLNQAAVNDPALFSMLRGELGITDISGVAHTGCALAQAALKKEKAFFISKAQNGNFHCFALKQGS